MSVKFKKVLFWAFSILLLINLAIILFDVTYVYKALRYQTANIDDYKLFDNRVIKTGHTVRWPLAAGYNKTPIPDSLNEELESLNSVAFLIIKDDSLVFEKYWKGYNQDSYSNSFSMAKSVVSILTGIALKEGKIKSLDQPVKDFLTEFNESKKGKITIRHLLTMTSGLNWQEAYLSPISHTTEAYYGKDLKKLINKLEVIEEPGTLFNYKSGDTQILSFVLETATGKTLSDYASEKLWKPLGATHNALWSLDKENGHEKAYCCLNSNARDFARIGQLYLNKGIWKNISIVPESYINESIRPLNIKDTEGKMVNYYGFSWWLLPKENIFYARGILGQYIIVIPDKRIVIVRLGLERGEKQEDHYKEVYTMIKGVNTAFNK